MSINSDITMNVHMDTMAWGDNDGVRDSAWSIMPDGGYIGVTGFDIYNLRIKARETDTYNGYNSWSMLKPITIDVATDPTYALYNGATFVRIGFGSLQITADHMHFNVQLGRYPLLNQMLGEVNIGALGVYINPVSYVDLYNSRPGSRHGIFMTTYFVMDRIDMAISPGVTPMACPEAVRENPAEWVTGSEPPIRPATSGSRISRSAVLLRSQARLPSI